MMMIPSNLLQPREVLERINKAKRDSAKELDLSSTGLSGIPPEVFDLEQLEVLRLSNNRIEQIPKLILRLRNLKLLDLMGNRLPILPEEIGQLSQLSVLNVAGNEYESLPRWIFNLPNLTTLHVGNYRLQNVPDWIGEMNNLTSLSLVGCGLTEIPSWLAQLKELRTLNLGGNDLTELPEWFFEMNNLVRLTLNANRLTNIPVSISKLQNLEEFLVWVNQLEQVPDSISQLKKLTHLDLGGNKLTHIPDSIRELRNLTHLSLGNNLFTSIPECIYDLTALEHLSLDNATSWAWYNGLKQGEFSNRNKIEELSSQISRLSGLQRLNLDDNPVKLPPLEIVAKGPEFIRNYFRQLEVKGTDYLFEAKLLIVGEGGAGKTTLAKKIENPEYQLRPEATTQGIDVIRWSFPMDNGKTFWVSIWDFGGQEIYHATHQFFLTKRSLYALVGDMRSEDTNFYYWLHVVELLSDNSPLMILKNEKQDRTREINEEVHKFTNLKEILSVNLAKNRGLDKVIDTIKHHVHLLPHVGTPLPKTWVMVRKELEESKENYISLDSYFAICKKHGFTEEKDKLQLSSYFHDLGVFLHFQEDPLLKKIVILKPKWATGAVYKVLDNKKVRQSKGCFEKSDLKIIWSDPQYSDMLDELLKLMMNFKLCYEIAGHSGVYIAPQLLSEKQPAYDWDEEHNLILKYTYEFMPKGIITRFIVAMHDLIVGRNCVWKNGVVLEKDETKMEVIEYYGKRELQIRIEGKYRRKWMTIVTYELDNIHASYKRLKYNKLVPCICSRCLNSQDPYFYSFDVLQRFSATRQDKIQCYLSYQMVDVRSLLDGIVEKVQPFDKKKNNRIIFTAPVDKVVVQNIEGGYNPMDIQQNEKIRSSWANGLFYLFTFVVVIFSLGFLAGKVPFYTLALVIIAGILFVPLIGALQLRQDQRLSEKSFMELVKIVIRQIPFIGRFAKQK
ncbi:MAG: COR domain-containing protein [Candidatus Omnitrophica bacterium]|nr:COR domain-containing protein [Candidatus Omnitrophota bacterium]